MEIEFRQAVRGDLEELRRIEEACFCDPWTEDMLEEELRTPHSKYALMIVDGEVAGYYSYKHILDEAHILNVAVLPAYQGRGLGSRMMAHLLADLPEDVAAVTLEVREGNAVARHLYEKCGFVAAGIRPKYYMDGENAVIYWYRRSVDC